MAKVMIVEIEAIYGTNDTNRGNQMMDVAGGALVGYLNEKAPQHEARHTQQKTLKADELREYNPEYKGGDITIDDQAILDMVRIQANEAKAQGQACIVGFRSVTPFFNHAVKLSAIIKAELPEVKIIIGGYHPSGTAGNEEVVPEGEEKPAIGEFDISSADIYASKKFKKLESRLREQHQDEKLELIDAFVVGEGEETLLELIERWEVKESLGETKGIIYKDGDEIRFTGRRPEMALPDEVDEEGNLVHPNYKKYYQPEADRLLSIPKKDAEGQTIGIEKMPSSIGCTQVGSFPGDEDIHGEIGSNLSRGCGHRCEFCSSQFICQGKVRFRDPEEAVREMTKYYLDPKFKTNFVYFFDLTFNAFYKENANEFCRLMAEARVIKKSDGSEEVVFGGKEGERIFGGEDIEKIHWFCLSEVYTFNENNLADVEKSLGLMADAGCTKIGFGIEGFTPKDIVHIKRVHGKDADEAKMIELGTERFARAAWVLKKATEMGIFTRGYFMWGTENQDESSFDKANALLQMEIPEVIFGNYEWLKRTIKFVFEEQAKYSPKENNKEALAPDIESFAVKEFELTPEQLSQKARMLEVDHLRLAFETPYPNTDVAKERTLRYYQYYRDDDGFIICDQKGKPVAKRFLADGKQLKLGKDWFFRHPDTGVVIEGDELAACEKKIDKTYWKDGNTSITLNEAIKNGWDDWEILSQEEPILDGGIPIEEIEGHPRRFIQEFYSSDAYHRSMEHRAQTQPRNLEGIYAWQKFWNDRNGRPAEIDGKRNFDFLTEEQKVMAEAKLRERAKQIPEAERQEWIDKHFLEGRRPTPEELREAKAEDDIVPDDGPPPEGFTNKLS
ncbi:MAG: radical SAM protein [Patescibacteria group bacterium]